ncbi:MAG TPA: ferritin-like domain-containing protein [Gammaproteobacteria bacterium]
MQEAVEMGTNRTGVARSMCAEDMRNGLAPADDASRAEGAAAISAAELDFLHEADAVGSVPVPKTVKGATKAVLGKLAGKNPEVLINKLGERLAFERSGARLYDSLITKCEAAQGACPVPVEELKQFREDEVEHFNLLVETLASMGADPTAQTPDADLAGVASAGVLQVVSDPRATIAQALTAMLTAELADNAGWELLAKLAEAYGLDGAAQRFRVALAAEERHLARMRQWLEQETTAHAGLA